MLEKLAQEEVWLEFLDYKCANDLLDQQEKETLAEFIENRAYLPLAGRRTVTMASSANLVKTIVDGGFPPTTAGNPRPYGMPPFGQILDDAQIAALASFVRQSWGNDAPWVSAVEVQRAR